MFDSVTEYNQKDFLDSYEKRMEIYHMVPQSKIIQLLGDISDQRVLDLGCGSGDLSKEMSDLGAIVTGLDISAEWIDRCLEKYGNTEKLNFICHDGTDLTAINDNSFDYVVMNMVLLNIPTLDKVKLIINEISRILKPNGTLIFSDLHPLTILYPDSAIRYVKNEEFDYFEDGSHYTAGIYLGGCQTLEFSNNHWTLETYTLLLEQSGLLIYRLSEPSYPSVAPEKFRALTTPEYLIFCCRKIL